MVRGGKKFRSTRASTMKGLVKKIVMTAFVVVNVLGIAFAPAQPALAASFTFTQDSWAVSADTSATAGHTGGAAQTGVTSFYSTSSSYLVTGTDLTIAASSGSFTQTSWTSVNQTTTATHTSNQTGWTSASTTDAQIDIGTAGSLKLSVVAGSVTQTNDGTTNSGFNLSGNSQSGVSISGTGDDASIQLGVAVAQISTGYLHSCALTTDGTVYCWGNNSAGELGDNTVTARATPVQVKGVGGSGYLTGVAKISAGSSFTCAVKTDGTAYCWGYGMYGVLGQNSQTSYSTPVQVKGVGGSGYLTGVAQISAGLMQTCAVKTDGTAYCWGYNPVGNLGDNTVTTRWTPVQVLGVGASGYLTGVSKITSGSYYDSGVEDNYNSTCAVKTDGTAYCWGHNNYRQLGDNTTTQRRTPVQVHGVADSGYLTGVSEISTGEGYTCAVKTDGTAYCWGYNGFGQLGDNTVNAVTTPAQVHGVANSGYLTGVSKISVGGNNNTCAVKTDGTVYCWGRNSSGQLGDNTVTQRNTPVQVLGVGASGYLTGIAGISVNQFNGYYGEGYVCAFATSGAAYCWGNNGFSNLGDNTTTQRNAPVQVHGVADSGYLALLNYVSGTYTSGIIDLGTAVDFTTIAWSETLNSQSLTIKVRSCDDSSCSGETAFASITQTVCTTGCDVGQGGTLNTLTSVTDGHQYVQYQVAFSSTDTAQTPVLASLTINEQAYPVEGTGYALVSSPFNTEDSGKGISSVSWTGATTSAASLRFQVRTSANGTSWSAWCGPTDCSGTDYFVDANNGGSIANTSITDGSNDQWFQYKAILTTSNGGTTPQLYDVSVAYARVLDSVSGYTLISSPYDSGSVASAIGDVRMNVTSLPSGTAAKIQVRTAASQGGLSSATWCGTDCTGSTYFTANAGTNTFTNIPSTLADGTDDEWFQYRITLIPSSNSISVPSIASAGVTYVVNTAPTVTNVTATTASTTGGSAEADAGKVTVTYDLTDEASETSDTYEAYLFYDAGVTLSSDNTTTLTVSDTSRLPSAPGYVQIGTEVVKYGAIVNSTTLRSLTRGTSDASWPGTSTRHTKAYTSGSTVWIKASATTGNVGSVTTGTSKTIVWDPASEAQLANYSNYTAKVRVLVHDSNLANQLSSQSGSSTDSSANVIIDNLAPTFAFTFDAGVAGSTDSATVSISTTGDATSTAEYMIADDAATHSSPTSTAWTSFTTPGSRTWTFDSDFEAKTLSVQVRDPYGNASATSTSSTLAPLSANAFVVADVSKVSASYWREFVGWETSTSSDFAAYKLDHASSADGVTYSAYATTTTPITTIAQNYFVHSDLTTTSIYRYRVGITGDNGNTSIRSSAYLAAKPDGTRNYDEGGGGDDTTAPTVTNVASSLVKATSATISFNAADGSSSITNATIYFATQADFTNNVNEGDSDRDRYVSTLGNPSYITVADSTPAEHSVALSNLIKNTTYRYAVESCDLTGNCRFEDNSDDGYIFTTQNGPAIVAGTVQVTPSYNSASITWKTDLPSDSNVFYATSGLSALVNPVTVGSNTQVTSADGDGRYVHTVSVPNLSYSSTYYYKVRSTDQNSASDSYTQYDESAIGSFTTTTQTPPTITAAPSCSATNSTLTVSWTTDQLSTTEASVLSANVSANYFSTVAGAQVAQYPTGTIDSASRASADYVTSHSNTFSGLSQSTNYYLKVRSLNPSGGEVSTTLTCTTSATEVIVSRPAVIQDVTPPIINTLVVKDITASAVTISWATDEPADSIVKHGPTLNYGMISGTEELGTEHEVTLGGLKPKTTYNFKVTSADGRGNRSYAGDQTVTTLSIEEEAATTRKNLETLKKELESVESQGTAQQKTESLEEAVRRFKAILKTVSSEVSLQDLEELTTDISDTITDITQELIPPAIIGGVPQVNVEANSASIVWRTNKPSGSIIALVAQDGYDATTADPYTLQVGQPQEEVTQHTVTVPNLEPSTVYHFQIRSQAKVGPEGKSRDFVFETKAELPQILDYSFKRITENSITVAWKTNTLSNSQVHYTPFDGTTLLEKESKTQGTPEFVKDHEVTVSNLAANTNFLIEIASADVTGASASKVIGTIHTTVDEQAPTISKVRSEATIFPGKTERTQTIIYWETDEPSTSQVFWKEGVGTGDFAQSSRLDKEYTTSHVAVITSFTPGAVYRFQVESVDPSGNVSRSTDYTILTPKKGETVIDLIITNFQDIFGFLKNL